MSTKAILIIGTIIILILGFVAWFLLACFNYDTPFSADLRSQEGRVGQGKLEEGETYEILLHFEDISASNHSWKAKIKVEIYDSENNLIISTIGSPSDFISRKTSGDGYTYYSKLTIAEFEVEQTGQYFIEIKKMKFGGFGPDVNCKIKIEEKHFRTFE